MRQVIQCQTISLATAQNLNDSGISIEVGCYVAMVKESVGAPFIVAVSNAPDHTLDSCQANLDQFCEEYGEGLDETICTREDYEFAIVV